MQTIPDSNSKAVVNFKLVSLLLALSIVLRIVAETISTSHPFLSACLTLLEFIGWTSVLLIWVAALIKGIPSWMTIVWTKVWAVLRAHWHAKKAKKEDTFVPVEELKSLRNDIQRLGLALHGMTPETEHVRRMYFQSLGQAAPALPLPPQNAVLHAEFESLVRFLNHFGFPHVECVRLPQRDFAFVQQWGCNLEARLLQQQQRSQEQQAKLRATLAMVVQQHKALGETSALTQGYSGYQRIQGALRLLEHIVNDQRCPQELAQDLVQKLQSDMDALEKQLTPVTL